MIKTISLIWLGLLIAGVLLSAMYSVASAPAILSWFVLLFVLPPWLLLLGTMAFFWAVVYRVQPAAERTGASQRSAGLELRWVGLNGLAWLIAAGATFAIAWRLGETFWVPSPLLDLLTPLFLVLVTASLAGVAQWAALAGVFPPAGRWAGYTAGGLGLGGAGFGLAFLCTFPVSQALFRTGWYSRSMVLVQLVILILLYSGALYLAGAFAGQGQARLLPSPPRSRWWLTSGLGMALGGLLGPFGGFIFGAVTALKLRQLLDLPPAAAQTRQAPGQASPTPADVVPAAAPSTPAGPPVPPTPAPAAAGLSPQANIRHTAPATRLNGCTTSGLLALYAALIVLPVIGYIFVYSRIASSDTYFGRDAKWQPEPASPPHPAAIMDAGAFSSKSTELVIAGQDGQVSTVSVSVRSCHFIGLSTEKLKRNNYLLAILLPDRFLPWNRPFSAPYQTVYISAFDSEDLPRGACYIVLDRRNGQLWVLPVDPTWLALRVGPAWVLYGWLLIILPAFWLFFGTKIPGPQGSLRNRAFQAAWLAAWLVVITVIGSLVMLTDIQGLAIVILMIFALIPIGVVAAVWAVIYALKASAANE